MKHKYYWQYFKYILEHKRNVFKTCWKRKLYLHAFTHDLSKFSPKEFFAYADWFYGPFGCKLEKEYDKEAITNGKSCLSNSYLKCRKAFLEAWKHHYEHNLHHWDHWYDPIENWRHTMPYKYLQQMIVDWEGMALKFGDTAQKYYLNNYKKIELERETRLRLEFMLGLNDSMMCNYGHSLEDFTKIYDETTYNYYFGFIKDKYGVDSYELLRVQ